VNKKDIVILYVEDEQDIRDGLVPILNYFADKLYIAIDGKDGLEQYKKCNPDIVISDIKMPNLNGIDMVKEIKKIDRKQHIIFTTAHSESGFFMEAINLQVDGYILKPIDLDLLELKIEDIIHQVNLKYRLKQQQTLINEIATLQNNLLIVLDAQENIIFSNENFLDFFQIDRLEDFKKQYQHLSKQFLQNENYCVMDKEIDREWLNHFMTLNDKDRVVIMIDIKIFEPKAFLVSIQLRKQTQHYIVTFTEITNIEIEKKEFQKRAFTDELTSIYNRAFFNEELDKQIARYKREQTPLCFFILDIDKFKNFNDNYGHQIGDEVLKDLANIIDKQTRKTDTFARWGGEEFVKILPNTSIESAMIVAEDLRKLVENHIFINDLRVTCSFGISEFNSDDTLELFMKRADDALYRAKENGRNRVEIQY